MYARSILIVPREETSTDTTVIILYNQIKPITRICRRHRLVETIKPSVFVYDQTSFPLRRSDPRGTREDPKSLICPESASRAEYRYGQCARVGCWDIIWIFSYQAVGINRVVHDALASFPLAEIEKNQRLSMTFGCFQYVWEGKNRYVKVRRVLSPDRKWKKNTTLLAAFE